jgi:hypothetical protein
MRKIVFLVVFTLSVATTSGQEISPLATAVDGPVPPTVVPGARIGDPPSDAIVLFDGVSLDEWESLGGGAAKWLVENGIVTVIPGSPSIRTKRSFGDIQLHVEWRAPTTVVHGKSLKADDTNYVEQVAAFLGLSQDYVDAEIARYGQSQYMANSGIFLQELYEIQVLETYGIHTYVNGQAGAVYKQHVPLVAATREPGEWQTYDIIYRAPRFGTTESVVVPATLTLLINGILVHNNVEIQGPTQFIGISPYKSHGPSAIVLQSHLGVSQISYRNIWVREL